MGIGSPHQVETWWRRGLRGARGWSQQREARLLGVILVVAGFAWAFVELADEVLERQTHAFDETVLLAMRSPTDRADPLGPPWLEEMVRDITGLGGVLVLTLITVAATVFLLLERKRRAALLMTVSVSGGWVLTSALKHVIERPRPALVAHRSVVYSASFPSGHALMSTVTFLTIAVLLTELVPRIHVKAYVLAWAVFMSVLVGVSRVYLGVHWPTDVLAGWTLGAAWALLCWAFARWLRRERHIDAA